ncbi:MAG: tetratricopeptide repeat protein [Chloroflexi bacterium]|nr:tetratricopeptide repeat protein [Chloroflexota bacterium]
MFPEFSVALARDYLNSAAKALDANGNDQAELMFIQARVYSQLGQQDEAERLARQALQHDPDRADIHAFLGDLLIRQDRLEEARTRFGQALALHPKIERGYRRLGLVLDRLGDRDGAQDAYEKAVALAPKDAQARLLLGRLLLDRGQAKPAAVHLAKACEIDPDSANAFYALAQAQLMLDDHDAAQSTLKTFQQLKRKEKQALDAENAARDNEQQMRAITAGFHTDLAAFYQKQRRWLLAETHLRQAVRVAPQEPAGYEMLAGFYIQRGQLTEARTACERLVRLRPEHAAYRINLGTLLLQLNDAPAAVRELNRALQLDPNQPEPLHNLARFYLGTRQEIPRALELARRLATLQPTAANYDLLAWACYANGQIDPARSASARAVKLDPANTRYQDRHRRLRELP